MSKEKILVIEDERDLVKLLKYNLDREGYRVFTASDGESGLAVVKKENPDLILLNVMLPKMDGFEFCRLLRQDSKIPIIMLTAKSEEVDRVLGLEMGADDYVIKPFGVREVLARVKAILRRVSNLDTSKGLVRAGDLEIDTERYFVRVKGKPITLSPKEFEFLHHLLSAKGKVLSRDQILERVWGYDQALQVDTRTVDQHMARLREKLGDEADRIITVKNVGYRMKLD